MTDRLHGHILSTILNIPHIVLDNPFSKLSTFHDTWMSSQSNAVIVKTKEDTVKEARKMLKKYNDELPKIVPYMQAEHESGKT